jgi:hypothetical protein
MTGSSITKKQHIPLHPSYLEAKTFRIRPKRTAEGFKPAMEPAPRQASASRAVQISS